LKTTDLLPVEGLLNVTLTVIDNEGAVNTDLTTCVVTQPNRPPTKPIITGPTNSTTNTKYNFTGVSTDTDNDTISYSITWGDVTSSVNTSYFLPSGAPFTCSHRWTTPGQYTLTVTATDNQIISSSDVIINIQLQETEKQTTPGFELVFVLCAIAIMMLLWMKKPIDR
jgi:hypothetical protein